MLRTCLHGGMWKSLYRKTLPATHDWHKHWQHSWWCEAGWTVATHHIILGAWLLARTTTITEQLTVSDKVIKDTQPCTLRCFNVSRVTFNVKSWRLEGQALSKPERYVRCHGYEWKIAMLPTWNGTHKQSAVSSRPVDTYQFYIESKMFQRSLVFAYTVSQSGLPLSFPFGDWNVWKALPHTLASFT